MKLAVNMSGSSLHRYRHSRCVFVTLTSSGKDALSSIKGSVEKTAATVCLPLGTKQMLLTNVKLINFMESQNEKTSINFCPSGGEFFRRTSSLCSRSNN